LGYLAQSHEAANSYIDAQAALRHLKVAADHFAILAEALCAAGQGMAERMEGLERAEVALENIREASTDLVIVNKHFGCGFKCGDEGFIR
jgi:hypothetical protein